MNQDIIKGNWKQIKGDIKKTWADFTADEIDKLDAEYETLVGKIQEKMGFKKEEAREKVNNLLKKYKS